MIAAVSTFSTETLTTCCAIARTTGKSTMNSSAIPIAERTTWIAIALRVLYHPFFCQKCFGSAAAAVAAAAPAPAPTTPAAAASVSGATCSSPNGSSEPCTSWNALPDAAPAATPAPTPAIGAAWPECRQKHTPQRRQSRKVHDACPRKSMRRFVR